MHDDSDAPQARPALETSQDIVVQLQCFLGDGQCKFARLEDKGTKRELFAMLRVREYFLFDPLAEYLKPAFQGFKLEGDEFIAPSSERLKNF